MSAAEKLVALSADAEITTLTYGAVVDLWDALPQIVAVVKAAETYCAILEQAEYEPGPTRDALAALDEQLQDLGSAAEPEAPTPRSEILKNGCEQALLLLERHRFKDDSEAKVVRAVLRAALDEALS